MPNANDPDQFHQCKADLLRTLELAATWKGRDPTYVSVGLLDMLISMLDLDFVFIRLEAASHAFIRMSSALAKVSTADNLIDTVSHWLALDPQIRRDRLIAAETSLSVTALPLGINTGIGWLVGGSQRTEFPNSDEFLRLSMASGQATIAIREMRQISDRTLPDVEPFSEALSEAENERALKLFLDNIPTAAWCTAADGMAEHFNQSLLTYVGKTVEELEGLGFLTQFHPDDLPRLLENWQEMMAAKKGGEHEGRVRRADGEYRWTLMRTNPLLDEEGNVIRWYGINSDIEDRKRAEDSLRSAEAALAASERNLNLIVESLPVLIWASPEDGSSDYVNQQYLDYVGLSKEEVMGWGFLQVIHPDDMEAFINKWKDQLYLDEAVNTARIRRNDGEYQWFYFSGRKFRDAGGNVRWFGVCLGIEDLKRTEDALRESEAVVQKSERRLRQIINTIPGLVWSADTEGTATFINQHYLDYIGFTEQEALGSGWARALHPEDMDGLTTAWLEMLRSGCGGDIEARLRSKDGGYRRFLFRPNPLRDDDGHVTQWFGVNFDIEDRRAAEENWRQTQGELAHVSRVITMGELAVSIAHEVNQPLMAMITNAGTSLRWLEEGRLNLAQARLATQRIVKDGHRAGEIVASIRALAKKSPLRIDRVELEPSIMEVVDLMRGGLRRGRIDPILSFLAPEIEVLGDRTQLQQVLLNLVMNAADAIAEAAGVSGRLLIQTSMPNDGYAQVSVFDNGRGLDPEAATRVFDAFYTTKENGIGMGLSICRSIIEAHGGQIWASQNHPEGCVFHFTVPLAPVTG